jgi:hypothetical protein
LAGEACEMTMDEIEALADRILDEQITVRSDQ